MSAFCSADRSSAALPVYTDKERSGSDTDIAGDRQIPSSRPVAGVMVTSVGRAQASSVHPMGERACRPQIASY